MTETTEVKLPKRLVILAAIEAGGATKESLMETADCSSASLATNFTYLRLMGKCPLKADDNTFSIISEEEWDAIQAERKAKAGTRKATTPKTPAELLAAAEKRMTRCAKALVSATTKAGQIDNEITDLRLTIATAENRLAEIALEEAQINMPEVDESEVSEDLVDGDVFDEDLADDDLV